MSGIIRLLDDTTINKIAAGEVIENPASVVKELIENAIDADAEEVCVEIQGGGRQLIRCIDNGSGMNRDDALLCLERNATSKIRDIEEIHGLTTMGFRGEAIPSIAAISKLTLLTRMRQDEVGTLLISEGGKIVDCSEVIRDPGTTVEVKSLFFNVPVRKKFQRSPAYDTNEILKVVIVQSLAHPDIQFRLISNQKNILTTSAAKEEEKIARFGSRISSVLGQEFFRNLCPIKSEYRGYHLFGYCGKPAYTRHNRSGQYLFINQRVVYSSLVSYAVKEGYGPMIEPNRHPVFALHLTMDGTLVDVNVHPQKREVRLRHEYQMREMIIAAVEGAFRDFEPIPNFSNVTLSSDVSAFLKPSYHADDEKSFGSEPFFIRETDNQELTLFHHEAEKAVFHPLDKAHPKVVATVPGYLILFSENAKLLLIDQQASHARILYDSLECSSKRSVQHLLVPMTVELPTVDAKCLKESIEQVNRLGISIQEFGQNSFIINGVPPFLKQNDIKTVLLEIVREIHDDGRIDCIQKELKKNLSRAAARAVLPRTRKLDPLEGQSLYEQLMQCQSPFFCPRGKPTLIELSEERIGKLFEYGAKREKQ